VRLPDRQSVFAQRAARFRQLAAGSSLRDYLEFLAVLVDAQQAALAGVSATPPPAEQLARSVDHGMPPIQNSIARQPWRATLELLCAALDGQSRFPAGVGQSIAAIRGASPAWLDAQAESVLAESVPAAQNQAVDPSVALFVTAALQVHGVALSTCFVADDVKALDVPGMCPLCGNLPVASLVCARPPYSGYRYLHCALCATEWHLVRVICSQCGASGKDIAYQSLESKTAGKPSDAGGAAVRAETCEQCRGYCKILYEEKDSCVEPVADDVASLALDLLLAEEGYHRARSNPLLWLPKTA
jgi:FdhE protein